MNHVRVFSTAIESGVLLASNTESRDFIPDDLGNEISCCDSVIGWPEVRQRHRRRSSRLLDSATRRDAGNLRWGP